MVIGACSPKTQEVDAGGAEFQGHPWLIESSGPVKTISNLVFKNDFEHLATHIFNMTLTISFEEPFKISSQRI